MAKGVRVQLIPEANAPHEILGDELRTLQALHCLMDNAIKYSAPLDVVQLQLSAVQVVEGREAVRFTVKDNGAGMGAQTLRSAVLPFVRDTGRINTQVRTGIGAADGKRGGKAPFYPPPPLKRYGQKFLPGLRPINTFFLSLLSVFFFPPIS